MKISDNGVNLIKHFEGFVHYVYKDAAGHPTIGYGHLIKSGEKFTSITKKEGIMLLKNDLIQFENGINRLVRVPLTQGEFDALVSFAFNLGNGALQRSTLLMKLNRLEYGDAADEFTRWVYAGGRRLKGLVRRREAERAMFLGEDIIFEEKGEF